MPLVAIFVSEVPGIEPTKEALDETLDTLLALATKLPSGYDSSRSTPDSCIWQGGSIFSLAAWLLGEAYLDISDLRGAWEGLEEMTVAGVPAAYSEDTLFVTTDKGVLAIRASVPSWQQSDLRAYAAAAAEVLVPRMTEGR